MTAVPQLLGPRVLLRGWTDGDLDGLAALNADAEVTAFLSKPLSRDESAAMMGQMQKKLEERGWGLWCADIGGRCAGFVGLAEPSFEAHFTPCVEIGWRLARWAWGHGYATEGARLALDHGFNVLGLHEIVSFTTAANARSRALMERLGMRRDPADDFNHPRLTGHHLEPHVLYRLQRRSA